MELNSYLYYIVCKFPCFGTLIVIVIRLKMNLILNYINQQQIQRKLFALLYLYHARFYLEMETQKFDWENLKISISTSNFKYYFNTYYYLYVTAIITSNIDHVFHNVCLPFLLSEKCLQIALLEVTQLHCIDPPICAALIKSQKS